MSKAEKFISDCTRNCSNVVAYTGMIEGSELRYHEWLTPDQALRAVEIAREEVIEDLSDKAKVPSGLDGFYYGQGYKQAEKDNELTWEDIEAIDQIFTDVFKDGFDVITNDYYKEVLKRFKERKGR